MYLYLDGLTKWLSLTPVRPSGYRYMVCLAISSYSFRVTALIFCRMFIHIMEVGMSTGLTVGGDSQTNHVSISGRTDRGKLICPPPPSPPPTLSRGGIKKKYPELKSLWACPQDFDFHQIFSKWQVVGLSHFVSPSRYRYMVCPAISSYSFNILHYVWCSIILNLYTDSTFNFLFLICKYKVITCGEMSIIPHTNHVSIM
jgi:hypothetical protein